MDRTHQGVVGSALFSPGDNPNFEIEALSSAMSNPLIGRPRRPTHIRVENSQLADQVRAHLGDDISIEVGPVPELDSLMEMMAEKLHEDTQPEDDYLDGRLSAEKMGRFFTAAAKVWRAAPWKIVSDSQVFQVDCPALGARKKAVSIIGALDESYGVLIFDRIEDYAILEASGENGPSDNLGTSMFVINFDHASDITASMRREVEQYGWTVADINGYPSIQRIDPDNISRPLTDNDVLFATVCLEGLLYFFDRHAQSIQDDTFTSAKETLVVEDLPGKPTVEITAPHPQFHLLMDEDDLEDDEQDEDANTA